MKKENFDQLIGSVKQMGQMMKGKKLAGTKVAYRAKPATSKEVRMVRNQGTRSPFLS